MSKRKNYRIPAASVDLINELDRRYPALTAREVSTGGEGLAKRAHQREVVETLLDQLESQKEDDLSV